MERQASARALYARLRSLHALPRGGRGELGEAGGGLLLGVSVAEAREEARAQLFLCAQSSLSMILSRCTTVVSLLFAARAHAANGASALAAASLAQSLANVSGNSMVVGAANALPTVVSQAFGAREFEECGRWAQRGWLVMLLLCAPIGALWLNAGPILTAVGQEEALASAAGRYIALLLPGLFAYTVIQAVSQFLTAQRVMTPQLRVSAVAALLHPLLNYLLVVRAHGGLDAAAACYSGTMGLTAIGLMLYLRVSDVLSAPHRTWPREGFLGWSYRSLQRWGEYGRLALPSVVMISEWWASEAAVLAGGYLPNAEDAVSALAINQTCNSVCFMVPIGIAMAGSARVGNRLGEGDAHAAKVASVTAALLGLVSTLSVGALVAALRHSIGGAFNASEGVRELLPGVFLILACYVVFDGLTVILTGVLRGAGRQSHLAPVVVVAYWVIGLPVAYALAFGRTNAGVLGLAGGLLLGTIFHCACVCVMVCRIDWQHECDRAAERIEVGRALSRAASRNGISAADGDCEVLGDEKEAAVAMSTFEDDSSADDETAGLLQLPLVSLAASDSSSKANGRAARPRP